MPSNLTYQFVSMELRHIQYFAETPRLNITPNLLTYFSHFSEFIDIRVGVSCRSLVVVATGSGGDPCTKDPKKQLGLQSKFIPLVAVANNTYQPLDSQKSTEQEKEMERGARQQGQVGSALPGHPLDQNAVHLILLTLPAQNQALYLLLRSGISQLQHRLTHGWL